MISGYALFDGTAGSKIETPDHATLDITGDIDLRVLAWINPQEVEEPSDFLISKGDVFGDPNSAYLFRHTSEADTFSLTWQQADLDGINYESDAGLVVFGAWRWYRVTLDVNDGASGSDVTFYYSDAPSTADPITVVWTLQVVRHRDFVTDINSSVDAVLLGAMKDQSDIMEGRIGYAEIRNGINGTIVADPDFRDADQKTGDSPTTFTDTTGKVWTFDTAVWVPPNGGGRGRRKIRRPRNPRRYQV